VPIIGVVEGRYKCKTFTPRKEARITVGVTKIGGIAVLGRCPMSLPLKAKAPVAKGSKAGLTCPVANKQDSEKQGVLQRLGGKLARKIPTKCPAIKAVAGLAKLGRSVAAKIG
jgi:hypothetical protein